MQTAERLARTFHKEICARSDSPTWTWEELNETHREWKIAAAQAVIDAGWCDSTGLKARLRAFGRDCVTHGDMAPAAQRMLDKIADEIETAWAAT